MNKKGGIKNWFMFQLEQPQYLIAFITILIMLVASIVWYTFPGTIICDLFLGAGLFLTIYGGFYMSWKTYLSGE